MEIRLSVSALKPKVQTNDPKRDLATSPSGRQNSAMSAAEITNVAQGLVDKMSKRHLPIMSERSLRSAAVQEVNNWVARSTTSKLPKEVKQKAATKLVNRVVTLFSKGAAPKPKTSGSPARKSLADTVDALLAGNKLVAPLLPTIRRLNDLAIGPVAEIKAAGFSSKKDAQSKADKLVGMLGAKGKKAPTGFSAPNGTDAKAKKFTKAEIDKIAERLTYQVRPTKGGIDAAVARAANEWAADHSVQYPNQSRLLSKDAVQLRLAELMGKKEDEPKKAPAKAPADKVVPVTKAATKEEKLKAQILAGTKLRNQFAGMLSKAPAMTSKSIENIRKHCDAYLKVINVVQKGKADLAETTKIDGLRGIESVKSYVNGIRGLTYGYVELAKQFGGTQTALGEKISASISTDLSNVELKRAAKANAQRSIGLVTKALEKRGCVLPASFGRDVEKVFVDGAISGDYKAAKSSLRGLIDNLVANVFSNSTKLFKLTK